MENKIKVLVVDDHPVVRAGLTTIMETEADLKIVGEARDGVEAVSKALELRPDVIMMDIFMPRSSGLEAMLAIKKELPEVHVLIVTISERDEDLFQALRFGAQGYLPKSASGVEVLEAVRRTAAGEAILSPSLAAKVVGEFRQKKIDETTLSEREREVLNLVGEGLTNKEIAKLLFISESTVRTHLQRILEKLHLKSRASAIAHANRQRRENNLFA
ncbi:MAG: response regulator transcription factor [Chloroflexota bacterium]